jgi:hypothetical protein
MAANSAEQDQAGLASNAWAISNLPDGNSTLAPRDQGRGAE